jgi:hypothetical protein
MARLRKQVQGLGVLEGSAPPSWVRADGIKDDRSAGTNVRDHAFPIAS